MFPQLVASLVLGKSRREKRPRRIAGWAAFLGAMLVWLLATQLAIAWTMRPITKQASVLCVNSRRYRL